MFWLLDPNNLYSKCICSEPGDPRRLPKVGKYAVDVPSFEKLALPVFDCTVSKISFTL